MWSLRLRWRPSPDCRVPTEATRIPIAPYAVDTPGGGGAIIHDAAIKQHGLELGDGYSMHRHIVLFFIAIRLPFA